MMTPLDVARLHPMTSIRKQGKSNHVNGKSRIHKAITGVDSGVSTTVSLSVFPENV